MTKQTQRNPAIAMAFRDDTDIAAILTIRYGKLYTSKAVRSIRGQAERKLRRLLSGESWPTEFIGGER